MRIWPPTVPRVNRDPARSVEDVALMAAIAGGDQQALAALYDRFSPMVFALCRRALRDPSAAEDLLEEIFVELWRRADRYDPARGGVATYLATLAHSRAIDRLRAMRRTGQPIPEGLEPVAPPVDPASGLSGDEQRRRISAALSGLSDDQRAAIELAYYQDLSHSEIAQRLNKPLGTVKTHIRQGLIRLRDALRTEHEGTP
jgi:RNA polymerase sigma-70 factor (ECF subfamily)